MGQLAFCTQRQATKRPCLKQHGRQRRPEVVLKALHVHCGMRVHSLSLPSTLQVLLSTPHHTHKCIRTHTYTHYHTEKISCKPSTKALGSTANISNMLRSQRQAIWGRESERTGQCMASGRQIPVWPGAPFLSLGIASRGGRKRRPGDTVTAAVLPPEISISQPVCKAPTQIGMDTTNYQPPAAQLPGSLAG